MSESTDRRAHELESGADAAPARSAAQSDDARFDEALRAWAARPPATPADRAAQRVAERLPGRTTTRPAAFRRLAVAASLVAAAGLALVLALVSGPGGPSGPAPAPDANHPAADSPVARAVPPSPSGDVLVIDLDPRTTLYLNLNGSGAPR